VLTKKELKKLRQKQKTAISRDIRASLRRSRHESSVLNGLAESDRAQIRMAARLACLDEDPIRWWDLGMTHAFNVVEDKIKILARQGQDHHLELSDVLELIAAERETVIKESLHGFYLSSKDEQRRTKSTLGPPLTVTRAARRCSIAGSRNVSKTARARLNPKARSKKP
jgi:hypothetical protein